MVAKIYRAIESLTNNKMPFLLEICANSLASALNAATGGADRIELCAELSLGGITPSAATIRLAVQRLNIPVFVLIRPRAGDFCYSTLELEVMAEDILFCKSVGCQGVVFGVLKADGTMDLAQMKKLVALARPMQVTFHRAFDVCAQPFEVLEQLVSLGVERVLTSGQQNKAIDGLSFFKKLLKQANNRIKILAGSGINAANVSAFQQMGIKEIHCSAGAPVSSLMTYAHPVVRLEEGDYVQTVSEIIAIRKMKIPS